MSRRSERALLGVLFPAAMVLLSGCHSREAAAGAADAPAADVIQVTRGSIAHRLNLAGQFEPYQTVEVHAKVSGYVRHIYVDIGDRVQAGQTLAVLEVPELDAQLKGTVAEVRHSRDEITRAQNEVTRAESEHYALHAGYRRLQQAAAAQPGLIAQQELDDARSKDLASQAQIDAARAALSAARQQSDVAGADNERVGALSAYTRVTAPLAGVIAWRYADTGALIQAGTTSDTATLPLVKLAQCDVLRLRLPVPEDAVPYIHKGAAVEVTVDALHRAFRGAVARYTGNVSQATRTMETEIDVPNRNLSLLPGMYANTTLELEHRDGVLTIPEQAVVSNGDTTTVLVVDGDDRVQPRPVRLGLRGSATVEVVSGLRQGERVISGGQSRYEANQRVTPRLLPASSEPPAESDAQSDAQSQGQRRRPGSDR